MQHALKPPIPKLSQPIRQHGESDFIGWVLLCKHFSHALLIRIPLCDCEKSIPFYTEPFTPWVDHRLGVGGTGRMGMLQHIWALVEKPCSVACCSLTFLAQFSHLIASSW